MNHRIGLRALVVLAASLIDREQPAWGRMNAAHGGLQALLVALAVTVALGTPGIAKTTGSAAMDFSDIAASSAARSGQYNAKTRFNAAAARDYADIAAEYAQKADMTPSGIGGDPFGLSAAPSGGVGGVVADPQASVNSLGQFVYTIPIEAPEGAGGLRPNVAITYNSALATQNGLLGAGFELRGIPMIKRLNYGNGINYTRDDTYVLRAGDAVSSGEAEQDGDSALGSGGRLVWDENDNGYYTAKESWVRLRAFGNINGTGPEYWKAYYPNGTIAWFGETNATRARARHSNGRGMSGAVRVWALTRIQDRSGNAMEYEYLTFDNSGAIHPSKITWTTGNGLRKHRTMHFYYEGRDDDIVSYADGSYVKINRRLKQIIVKDDDRRIRSYECKYEYSPLERVSRITRIKPYDASGSEIYGDGYTINWENGNARFEREAVQERWMPRTCTVGDVTGDLIADLVFIEGNRARVWEGKRSGGFMHPSKAITSTLKRESEEAPGRYFALPFLTGIVADNHGPGAGTEYQLSVRLADVDNDGRDDLCVEQSERRIGIGNFATAYNDPLYSGTVYIYAGNGDGTFRERPMNSYRTSHKDSALGDVDGDGLVDRVEIGFNSAFNAVIEVRPGNASGSFAGQNGMIESTVITSIQSNDDFIGRHGHTLSDRNTTIQLTDINGDGLPDMVFRYQNIYLPQSMRYAIHKNYVVDKPEFFIHLNKGNGRFERQGTYAKAHTLCATLADVTGDGLPDMVCIDNQTHVYPGKGDGSFRGGAWTITSGRAGQAFTGISSHRVRGHNPDFWNNNGAYSTVGGMNEDDIDYNQYTSSMPNVIVSDLNGDGTPDTLFMQSHYYRTHWETQQRRNDDIVDVDHYEDHFEGNYAVHLNSWSEPYAMVKRVDNPQGATTKVEMKSYAHYGNLGVRSGSGIPSASNLPLVVEKETRDGAGASYLRQFEYFDRRYYVDNDRGRVNCSRSRRDLGFAKVVEKDPHTKLAVELEYFQDIPRERVQRSRRVYNYQNGNTLSERIVTGTDYYRGRDTGISKIASPDVFSPRVLILPRGVRETHFIEGNKISEEHIAYEYDNFGNTTEVRNVARDNDGSFLQTRKRHARYINQTSGGPRVIGMLRKEWMSDGSENTVWNLQRWFYDNKPSGQVGNKLRITRVEMKINNTWAPVDYWYDRYGNIVKTRDPSGIIEEASYDSTFGVNLTEHTLPDGRRITYEYETRYNAPSRITNTDTGLEQIISYDRFGRCIKVIERDSRNGGKRLTETTYDYHVGGAENWTLQRRWRHNDSNFGYGIPSVTCRDGLNRIYLQTEKGFGGKLVCLEIRYDDAGRKEWESEPYFEGESRRKWTHFQYNSDNRLSKITLPNGGVKRIDHGRSGRDYAVRYTDVTDVRGKTQRNWYDHNGQITRTVRANGTDAAIALNYEYDVRGLLVKTTRPDGQVIKITYDEAGRRTEVEDPDAGIHRFFYGQDLGTGAFSKVIRENKAAPNAPGQRMNIFHEYDRLGRVASTNLPGNHLITYTYDQNGGIYGFGNGSLTSVVTVQDDFKLIKRYGYDLYGDKTFSRRLIRDGNKPAVVVDYTLSFDELRRLSTVAHPNGRDLKYYYNDANQVMRIKFGSRSVAVFKDYDARGKVTKVQYGNGCETFYAYDAAMGWLEEMKVHSGDNKILHYEYQYENSGLITKLIDRRRSDYTKDYSYDRLERLRKVERADGSVFRYTFDNDGRLTGKATLLRDGSRRNLDLAYDGYRLTSLRGDGNKTYAWSDAGSMIERDGEDLRYNGQMMLYRVGYRDYFFYDELGVRALKKHIAEDGSVYKTFYAGYGYEVRQKWSPNEAALEATQTTSYVYSLNGERLYQLTEGEHLDGSEPENTASGMERGPRYFHSNHLQSASAVTDGNGQVLHRFEYLPYGEIDHQASKQPDQISHKFTGQERDLETGLDYFTARYYDSYLGIFTTADSIIPDMMNPLAYNRYLYVYGNPIRYNDPSGHEPENEDSESESDSNSDTENGEKDIDAAFETVEDARADRFDEAAVALAAGKAATVGQQGLETALQEKAQGKSVAAAIAERTTVRANVVSSADRAFGSRVKGKTVAQTTGCTSRVRGQLDTTLAQVGIGTVRGSVRGDFSLNACTAQVAGCGSLDVKAGIGGKIAGKAKALAGGYTTFQGCGVMDLPTGKVTGNGSVSVGGIAEFMGWEARVEAYSIEGELGSVELY